MSRLPVTLLAASAKPTGREAVWAAIRRLRTFTRRQLERETDVPGKTIADYLKCLAAGQVIEADAIDITVPAQIWRLADDRGVEAPRLRPDGQPVTQGLPREQMWRTMRSLKGAFSPAELAIAAATDSIAVSAVDAADYCFHLERAGYLRLAVRGTAKSASSKRRYQFVPVMYTGPKPPMVARTKLVWDSNRAKVMWMPEIDR